jgi:hypothetical protein
MLKKPFMMYLVRVAFCFCNLQVPNNIFHPRTRSSICSLTYQSNPILYWLLADLTCLLSAVGRAAGVTAPLPAAPGCWNRTDRATAVFAIAKDEVGAAEPEDCAEDDDDDEADDDDDDDAESGEEVGEDGDEEGAEEEDAPIVAQPNAKLQALWQCTIITEKRENYSN